MWLSSDPGLLASAARWREELGKVFPWEKRKKLRLRPLAQNLPVLALIP